MVNVYSKLYNKCTTPISVPRINRDFNNRWDTNWDSLNNHNCIISLGLEHGERANRFNTAEIQQLDFHLLKKSKHVSDQGIGNWYVENWKLIAKFCKTYGQIKAYFNNASAGRHGLFVSASRVLDGDNVFDNANCNVHAEHLGNGGRGGLCDACDLIVDIRNFQLSWETVSRDSKGMMAGIPHNIIMEFIKLMKSMIKNATFLDTNGGINLRSFAFHIDEIFVHVFKELLSQNQDQDSKATRKAFAKLESKTAEFGEITGFYQRSYQHVHDNITVDWFSGPGGDEDNGFIMSAKIRVIVTTVRAFSIDLERVLNTRITRALDIMGRPRDETYSDNVLLIGTKKSRVKRRWSDGNKLISNNRNDICRGLLYEFLNEVNDFRNFTRDPEAVFFLNDDEDD